MLWPLTTLSFMTEVDACESGLAAMLLLAREVTLILYWKTRYQTKIQVILQKPGSNSGRVKTPWKEIAVRASIWTYTVYSTTTTIDYYTVQVTKYSDSQDIATIKFRH